MNITRSIFAVLALCLTSSVWAYQVTGPVLELTDSRSWCRKARRNGKLPAHPIPR
jgi:hypothetical protein